MLNQQLPLG
ncbi:Putative uncharacterized protein [Lactococcus lactis subsp. lactis A12]|uniref:Uncharacterized protein n=1 Tax=Lactococcus lactis subsp. lactis A12 TaxID=1137134 RepID=S6FGG0_LACLL|nr:Putative uncharacterized protein [Lactococcus lactis subsp. lactis A12]